CRTRKFPQYGAAAMSAAAPNSAQNRPMAELHLRLLAPGAQFFTFQSYSDSREKRDGYTARGMRDPLARILHGSLDEKWDELEKLSAAGAGIYVCANETDFRGRSAANIIGVRVYFSDLDGAPLENLRRIALPPHFVAHTSADRFHAYWRVGEASIEQ